MRTKVMVEPVTLTTVDYSGCHVYRNGRLERVGNSYGYWADSTFHYHITDYQGNIRAVIAEDGALEEVNNYYPYGGLMGADGTMGVQPHKYGAKELDRENGLDLYDSHARWYDPLLARTTTQDPLAEKYCHLSPYLWCAGNPIKFIDPLGKSTNVVSVGNNLYRVYSVNLDDNDKNIYVNINGIKQIIGVTPSMTTFYASGKGGKGGHIVKSIINLNDRSGMVFKRCVKSNPNLAKYVNDWGRSGHKWDFKNIGNTKCVETYQYRGMPLDKDASGKLVITSARDLGNWAAGYIAGVNGISWVNSRLVFDSYEMISSKRIGVEEISTINAEFSGWQEGHTEMEQCLPTIPVPIDW